MTNNQRYQDLIIQVSTPYNTGLGFYVEAYNLLVTNAHIVEGNRDVVISGSSIENSIAPVLYVDQVYDLAFLEPPVQHSFPTLNFDTAFPPDPNNPIWTLDYDETHEIILGTVVTPDSITNEKIEAPFFPTNFISDQDVSGTPIINGSGNIVGMTTFYQVGKGKYSLGISAATIKETLETYQTFKPSQAIRCEGCKAVIAIQSLNQGACPSCGEVVDLPQPNADYEPTGIGVTIESLIKALGHSVRLSRRGPYSWAIKQGSATIHIAYYEPLGYITADAFLCKMTEEAIYKKAIYQFLLKQNAVIRGLTFSVREQDIVLSLIIYDRNFNIETALLLFQNLLEQADYYDDVLVDDYHCEWK